MGSNTPRSNFGWNDIRQFGLDNEPSSGGRWDQGAQGNTSGIPQTMRAGIYYADKIGKNKKARLNFNYSYYNERLDAISSSRSQYFLADTVYYTEDSTRNIRESQAHRINFEFEAPLDSFTTIRIKPSVNFDYSTNQEYDGQEFIDEDGNSTLATNAFNNYEGSGYTVDTRTSLKRKFRKKGRELEVIYDFELDNSETQGQLLTTSQFNNILVPFTDSVDQRKENISNSVNHYVDLRYTEPLNKNFRFETEYQYENGVFKRDKVTYDRNGQEYTDRNDLFSNVFDTYRDQHWIGMKMVYEDSKHTVGFRGLVRDIHIDNINQITGAVVSQNFTNFLPIFDYSYKPTKSKRLTFKYRTNSQQPSITDLQPVPDNTNPNSIRKGNPNLQPNYVHNLNLNFNSWQVFSGQFIWTGLSAVFTDNAFASSTSFNEYGQSESQTVNVDGNMFSNLYAGASFPLYKRIISIRPNANGGC